jgi:hypothetical protein
MIQFLVLFVSLISFAQSGKVLLARGQVFFNGKPVKKDMRLAGAGTFTLGDRSYLKLLLEKSQSTVVLGANSKSEIDFSQKSMFESEVNLLKGNARWITGDKKTPGGGVRTSNAIIGIRGTDFLAIANPVFGETEVVCFDGSVELSNQQNISDSKIVGKNQWGGIGGRFGKNLSEILTLNDEIIAGFKTVLPLK